MKDIKPTMYISLAEYAWEFHKRNDLDMALAIKLKDAAFNIPNKKIREKKNIKTPLLQTAQWHKVWDEIMSK